MQPSDWKTFRARLPVWRERYLETTTRELSDLLRDGDLTPTERFWQAKARIDDEAKVLRMCLDRTSRSKLLMSLMLLYGHGLIDAPDLDAFSDELKDQVLQAVQDDRRSARDVE